MDCGAVFCDGRFARQRQKSRSKSAMFLDFVSISGNRFLIRLQNDAPVIAVDNDQVAARHIR